MTPQLDTTSSEVAEEASMEVLLEYEQKNLNAKFWSPSPTATTQTAKTTDTELAKFATANAIQTQTIENLSIQKPEFIGEILIVTILVIFTILAFKIFKLHK